MMWWTGNGYGMAGWGAVAMVVGLFLLVGLVVAVIVALTGWSGRSAPADRPGADELLDERFARGEIDVAEYEARRAALLAAQSHRSTG